MRTTLAVLLFGVLVVALAACGRVEPNVNVTPPPSEQEECEGGEDLADTGEEVGNQDGACGGPEDPPREDEDPTPEDKPDPREEIERRMADLLQSLHQIPADQAKKKKLYADYLKEKGGAEFWVEAVQRKLIDDERLEDLVLPEGDEVAAADSDSLTTANVSFCAPRGGELLVTMMKRGTKRTVLLCPLGKYWDDFNGELPILWSDSQKLEWLTLKDFEDWDVTEEEWSNPSEKLIGQKAPFDLVFE